MTLVTVLAAVLAATTYALSYRLWRLDGAGVGLPLVWGVSLLLASALAFQFYALVDPSAVPTVAPLTWMASAGIFAMLVTSVFLQRGIRAR